MAASINHYPREPVSQEFYHSVSRPKGEARFGPKETKLTVEEVFPRGHGPQPQPQPQPRSQQQQQQQPQQRPPTRYSGSRSEIDDDDFSSDDEYEVQIRHPSPRTRARSIDSGRTGRPRQSESRSSRAGSRRAESRRGESRGDKSKLIRYDVRRRSADDSDSSDSDDGYHSGDEDRRSRSSSKGLMSKALIKPVTALTKACGTDCAENGHREPASLAPPRAFPLPDSDDEYASDEHERQRKERVRKRMIYTGLASMGTILGCNTVYQNHKGFKQRREALAQGTMCAAEAKHLRNKAMIEDAIAMGLVAVAARNTFYGWKKVDSLTKQDRECRNKWDEKREERNREAERERSRSRRGDRRRYSHY